MYQPDRLGASEFMRILQVIAHPRQGSLSHQFSQFSAQHLRTMGHEVVEKDLYQQHFDPVLRSRELKGYNSVEGLEPSLKQEVHELMRADYLIFFYPVWWWERPAILKGWFDRVFVRDVVFKVGGFGVSGCLKTKGALVVQTFGDSEKSFQTGPGHLSVEGGVDEGTLKVAGVKKVNFLQYFSTYAFKKDDVAKAQKKVVDTFLAMTKNG